MSEILYRSVRELLANVRQHAKASRVQVSSSAEEDGTIRISVADNGVGLPPNWRRSSPLADNTGVGLWSIDQRLRTFGAELEMEWGPDGTRATLVVPVTLLKND